MPLGFNFKTYIDPVVESTLMRSVSLINKWSSELSKPAYVQVLAYDPQFRFAEKGVIGNWTSDTPYATENDVFD